MHCLSTHRLKLEIQVASSVAEVDLGLDVRLILFFCRSHEKSRTSSRSSYKITREPKVEAEQRDPREKIEMVPLHLGHAIPPSNIIEQSSTLHLQPFNGGAID